MFWITNPSNDFVGNVAVGGQFGFWFAMPLHPLGFAASDPKYLWWPRHSKLGLFIRNKAHSMTQSGLFFDDGQINNQGDTELSTYSPRDVDMILNNFVDNPSATDLDVLKAMIQDFQPLNAVIVEFTAYKVRTRRLLSSFYCANVTHNSAVSTVFGVAVTTSSFTMLVLLTTQSVSTALASTLSKEHLLLVRLIMLAILTSTLKKVEADTFLTLAVLLKASLAFSHMMQEVV